MLTEKDKSNKIITLLLSSISATIVASAILHVLYTQLLPLNELTAALLLLLPTAYIGLLNEDVKESMIAMSLTAVSTIVLTSFSRSLPALLGVFPSQGDFFAFIQVAETLPLFFLMIPFFIIGTMIGVIVNEFALKTRY